MIESSYKSACSGLEGLIEAAKKASDRQGTTNGKNKSSADLNWAVECWRSAALRSAYLLAANHDTTIFCQVNLGRALGDAGHYEEAVSLLEMLLTRLEERGSAVGPRAHLFLGPVFVGIIYEVLARAHSGLGNELRSCRYWLKAASSSQEYRQLHNSSTIYCYHQAARSLARLKLREEALLAFKLVYDGNNKLFGDHLLTAFAARDLAVCLNRLKRFAEARQYWVRAQVLMEAFLPEQHDLRKKVAAGRFWTDRKVRDMRKERKRLRRLERAALPAAASVASAESA
ncbi:MAG TPA: tetratricopeptide repeat protein [Candidatus Obscuribacter sp.]|nr:tetratricopeptide repeat protein [Candidatus Obscuribacter sp.]MBK9280463.1 tetratricopeptide repeat protein [Candidatus Obscuribacter sp.]MBL8082664.1 tetratricopeptide repeat protein [Candidatus Obscuribacter sp.]HNB15389.1 tetratricopeptide repeat protein [Candidatus Obscuribacter sp.]HND05635.1 tetratricopeptide repeat protein [Candidatus Obscuribacter sp.]